ncbi:MAG: hypothetical protein WCP20_22910, partial [Desulfuromonadales bacterium]
STLTGGVGSVAGSFAFTTPTTIPTAVGNYSASVTFTPTDATNYNTVSGTVTVAVAKATPTITTLPTASGITFGQALSASTLTGGVGSVAGSFAFTTPATVPPAVGNYSASVTFTPTDAINYKTVSGTVTVVVAQPDITPPAVVLYTPAGDAITNNPTLSVTGNVVDEGGISALTLTNNGVSVNPLVDPLSGDFSYALTLAEGENVITATAVDNASNSSTTGSVKITYDPKAPVLTVIKPTNDSKIAQSFTDVTGSVNEAVKYITVTVLDKNQIQVDQQTAAMNALSFSATVNLAAGVNTVVVTSVDLAGNTSKESRKVTSDTTKPNVAITDPAADITTALSEYTITGSVSDLYTSITSVAITVVDTSTSAVIANYLVAPSSGTFAQKIQLPEAKQYQISVVATNEAGTVSNPAKVNIIKQSVWNDVSGQVTVLKASPVYNLTNDLYYVTVKVTNKAGNSPLSGKIRMVVTNPSKAFKPSTIGLGVPDGYLSPTEPYFYIQSETGTLAAGASITVKNTFVPLTPITFGVRIEQQK